MHPAAPDDDRIRDALDGVGRERGAPPSDLVRLGRRSRLFLAVAVTVTAAAVGVAVFVAVGSMPMDGDRTEVPGWQDVVGSVLAVCGLVLQLWGLVRLLRAQRAARSWSSPLFALTRRQRKLLLAQVRGTGPVDPTTLPLAVLTAQQLHLARLAVLGNLGLVVLWTGLWVGDPAPWRGFLAAALVVLLGLGGAVVERDARRGERFLIAHAAA